MSRPIHNYFSAYGVVSHFSIAWISVLINKGEPNSSRFIINYSVILLRSGRRCSKP